MKVQTKTKENRRFSDVYEDFGKVSRYSYAITAGKAYHRTISQGETQLSSGQTEPQRTEDWMRRPGRGDTRGSLSGL